MDQYLSWDFPKFFVDALLHSPWKIAAVVVAFILLREVYKLYHLLIVRPRSSLLRELPGPSKGDSLLFGQLRRFLAQNPNPVLDEWHAKYGDVFQFRTAFRIRQLVIYDPKAITHIVNHAYEFPKPYPALKQSEDLMGLGLLSVEGDAHRRQRKIINPSFGPAQIRDLMPIFYEKAEELRDMWLRKIGEPGSPIIDAVPWLSKATLDVVGLAGFNYRFNSIAAPEDSELVKALADVFRPYEQVPIAQFLQALYPVLEYFFQTKRAKTLAAGKAKLQEVGMDLVRKNRAHVENTGGARDLLSVLIKANSLNTKDVVRLSDKELLGQIGTVIFAGHETTSNGITWAFWELAKPENRAIVERLRAEVSSVSSSQPTMEELNALPYLDAVVKESMRKNSPVDAVTRVAGSDTVIPLAKPFTDRYGAKQDVLKISKNDPILLPITTLNTSKEMWGEDAKEFKPERWLNPNARPRSSELPGVWGLQMSFNGGPRACIGWRMAVMEMKVFLFVFVRRFDFHLPSPVPEIIRKPNVVARPTIKLPNGKFANSMPLVVKPLSS